MRLASTIALLIAVLFPLSKTYLKSTAQTTTDRETITRLKQELRKPLPAENQQTEREAIARQQVEVAARLLQLGQADAVWPLFAHSPDSTLRTYLIHGLVSSGVSPSLITRRLRDEKDV
ncbi:MAG TPA: hypothetical protein VF074_22840, partial [Pyrinomonadaceae bacterium]